VTTVSGINRRKPTPVSRNCLSLPAENRGLSMIMPTTPLPVPLPRKRPRKKWRIMENISLKRLPMCGHPATRRDYRQCYGVPTRPDNGNRQHKSRSNIGPTQSCQLAISFEGRGSCCLLCLIQERAKAFSDPVGKAFGSTPQLFLDASVYSKSATHAHWIALPLSCSREGE
jgi:hypothetical protein